MRPSSARFFRFPKYFLPGGVIVLAMSVFIWRFALTGSKTLFQGDEIVFGLPLFALRTRAIEGAASMLWSNAMYGGHPIFAEGTGAFLSPLSLLLSVFVTPIAGAIYSLNLFTFLCMALSGVGMVGLCRSLKLSPWAAALAAMAVVFSPVWLEMDGNPAWCGTLLWCPWALWAFEVWLSRPSLRAGTAMGLVLGNAILAGYPQVFHGLVVYMAVALLPSLGAIVGEMRKNTLLKTYAQSGLLAVFVCVGIALVQLLPMSELVPFSHRRSGVDLEFSIGEMFYTRGLLFSFPHDGNMNHYAKASVGSLLVCALASLAVFFPREKRLFGHFLAGIALLTLGYGNGSAVFRLVYQHDLIPGLHNFRTVYHYLAVGTVGIAVAAAGGADLLAKLRIGEFRRISGTAVIAVALAAFWGWVLATHASRDVLFLQYLLPVLAVACAIILIFVRRAHLFPVVLTVLLLVECLAIRSNYFRLIDTAALSKPETVRAIQATPDWQDYRSIDISNASGFQFGDVWGENVRPAFARMMGCMTELTPILWKMKTIDGALALTLARRFDIQQTLVDEINGKGPNPPGLRLIDILSVRYVCVTDAVEAPGFREFWHRPGEAWIMENGAARPRFQIYDRAVTADSPDAALTLLRSAREPVLAVEDPKHLLQPLFTGIGEEKVGAPAATFDVKKAKDAFYRVDVTAVRPCWLFLADASYPGWSATVDGRPASLFAAQVLGKAVQIPAGQHRVTIEFHSASFTLGAWVSGGTLLLVLAIFVRSPSVVRRPDRKLQ